MSEYSFVSIRVARRRAGNDLVRDYREVIREHAVQGWEFVQALSLEAHIDPRIDLVFVKKGASK